MAVCDGDPASIATYRHHDRISDGPRADVLDRAYRVWTDDGQQGLSLAATNREADALNVERHPANEHDNPERRTRAVDRLLSEAARARDEVGRGREL